MRGLRVALALGVITAATVLGLNGRWPWRRLVVAAPIVVTTAWQKSADTLHDGETLGDLFGRQGLASADLVGVFARVGLDPRRLRAGVVVEFRREAGQVLPSDVSMRTTEEERLSAHRIAEAWTVERKAVAWTSQIVRIQGPIDNSLYEALDGRIADGLFDAGNRVRLAWDLAEVYAWSIDFNRDIQPGDSFAVILKREVSEEGEVRVGGILAANLLVGNKHQAAFRFEPPGGPVRFYDAEGNSLRRAFLRAPIEFRRISSSFSRSRYHPVLGIWRRHEGTDYAAGSGTPVLAAGDGTVRTAGPTGGYGNLVELRHINGITTRYGHLRSFARGIRVGSRVAQGEVIGQVGSTGLATAPHLHYEFRVNGAARDSRRVDLGSGKPLERSLMPLFESERVRLEQMLASAGSLQLPPP
jgi:murein DD-endopeptidase MepM/ murein hydrolase activator NlpD